MAERVIKKFRDPVLREESKPVQNISNIYKLLDDMSETLKAASNGAALAAPQVGVTKRIVVLKKDDEIVEMINPEIIQSDGKQVGPEGCLSFPGYFAFVKRAKQVTVKALNRYGEEFTIEGEDFLARCLQHEIDHLDGILFFDHSVNGKIYEEKTGEPLNTLEAMEITGKII